jgi:hypothetical protein
MNLYYRINLHPLLLYIKVPLSRFLPVFLLHCLFWNAPAPLYGQLDSLAEVISESMPDQEEINSLLEEFTGNPLDINTASRAELEYFSFLTPAQIDTILESRPFKHKSALAGILGRPTYKLFAPFFTVSRKLPPFHSSAAIRWQSVLERSRGLKEKIYRGSAGSVYTRLQFQYRPMLSGGILTQKDAGESSLYDHYAGFLQWQDPPGRFKIILGTYQIQAAQGLVFAAPFSNSKGIFPMAPSYSDAIRTSPFLSSGESNGFLGMAGQLSFSDYARLTFFYSNRSRDATLADGQIKNIASSGYHRTTAEIMGMDALCEKIMGTGGSVILSRNISLGALMFSSRYKTCSAFPTTPAMSTAADSIPNFLSGPIKCCSFFGRAALPGLPGLQLSAELATNNFRKMAGQFMLAYSYLDHEVGLKWWLIPKEFISPFGRSFASNSPFPRAKNGVYLAVSGLAGTNFPVDVHWTIEKDLWPGAFNPLPLFQKEFAVHAGYHADRSTLLSGKYRYSEHYYFSADKSQTGARHLYQFRLQLEKSFAPRMRIRCRLEKMLLAQKHPLNGINLYHDLDYRIGSAINLIVRFSSFGSDDYLVHTYEYENDLPGVFSSYSVYGKGNKWYLLIKWQISDQLTFWVKYRKIYLDGVSIIGSGNDLINNDQKQDVRFQLNWKY